MRGLGRTPIARVSNCTIPLLDDIRLISSLFLLGSICRLYSFLINRSERLQRPETQHHKLKGEQGKTLEERTYDSLSLDYPFFFFFFFFFFKTYRQASRGRAAAKKNTHTHTHTRDSDGLGLEPSGTRFDVFLYDRLTMMHRHRSSLFAHINMYVRLDPGRESSASASFSTVQTLDTTKDDPSKRPNRHSERMKEEEQSAQRRTHTSPRLVRWACSRKHRIGIYIYKKGMTKHTAATPSTSRVGKPTSKLRVISLSMYMYSDWIQKCFSEIACAIGGRRTELLSNPGWIKESELASFATHEKAKRGRYICYLKVECGRGPSGTQVHCCSTHTLFVLCCFVLFFLFSLFLCS